MVSSYRNLIRENENIKRFLSNKDEEGFFDLKEEYSILDKQCRYNQLTIEGYDSYWNDNVLNGYLLVNWPNLYTQPLKFEYYLRIFVPFFSEYIISNIIEKSGEFEKIKLTEENDRIHKIDLAYKDLHNNRTILLQIKSGPIRRGVISSELITQHKAGFKTSCVYISFHPIPNQPTTMKIANILDPNGKEFSQLNEEEIINYIRYVARTNEDFYFSQEKAFPSLYSQMN